MTKTPSRTGSKPKKQMGFSNFIRGVFGGSTAPQSGGSSVPTDRVASALRAARQAKAGPPSVSPAGLTAAPGMSSAQGPASQQSSHSAPGAAFEASTAGPEARSTQHQPRKGLIESTGDVPQYSGLLTVGPKSVYSVPQMVQGRLIALELGPKRSVILYDPAILLGPHKIFVQDLRNKLLGSGYSHTPDLACRSDVITAIVDDFVKRSGVADNTRASRNAAISSAGARAIGWIKAAVKEGATDLHVCVESEGRGIAQLRVDGSLEMVRDEAGGRYTESDVMLGMAYIYNQLAAQGSNSDGTWDQSSNLYCMTTPIDIDGSRVVLRYQSIRGDKGPKLVCRLLHVGMDQKPRSYVELGYAKSHREILLEVGKMPSGLVLFAGVTGSGKTTTLKTFVETHRGNGSMAMYSIEDPVEYPLRGVHQIPLQRSLGDKAESTRAFLQQVEALMRADPDMVIVGEVRDSASAAAAQVITETGHMALGTVHAHLISAIVPRLTNSEVGMSRDVLTNPNMLTLLAYQALVPKLCPMCALDHNQALAQAQARDKAGVTSGGNEAELLAGSLRSLRERFHLDLSLFRFKNIKGCSHCSGRGTKGLTVVAEMLIPDRRWLELTRAGQDDLALRHYRDASDRDFMSDDMTGKTVFEHALYKALMGQIDPTSCETFGSFKHFEILPPRDPDEPNDSVDASPIDAAAIASVRAALQGDLK